MAFNWGSVDWGSLAGAAASAYSANQASKAAKNAGNAAAAGSDAATGLSREIYQDQRALNMPFYNAQLAATNQYNALLGLPSISSGAGGGMGTPGASLVGRDAQGVPIANAQLYASDPAYKAAWDATVQQHQNQWRTGYWNGSDASWIDANVRSRLPTGWAGGQPQSAPGAQSPAMTQQQAFAQFRNTPGYQFGLDQGTKAVQSSAAAKGGLFSGAAMKALQKFGNDYADQQGYTPYVNRIAAAAGIGQTNPVGTLTNAAGQYGQQAGGFMQNAANARATGLSNAAGARQQGWQDAAGFLGQWYGNRG